jgi:hypothetical protein
MTMQLVEMINADGKSVDVHPDEVENYAAGGYQVVKPVFVQPSKKPTAKRKAKR